MAADLECYDENGYATLTASTLFGRVLGTFNTGTTNGSLYFAGLTSAGAQPWHMSFSLGSAQVSCYPQFTIANDVISWTFTDFWAPGNSLATRINTSVMVGTD
jgi:hypothetical protein